ncbi:18301_t:CDS:2 [Funneliformis geosporum]|uniref:18301_t:CDS:1 n=1 Tax=Funneliformis geosporum TaxID=1117311 RepID=A0A9W4SKH9_9GLOM|nr:18301_t:CDS:2 [Funneliformis geosporum]
MDLRRYSKNCQKKKKLQSIKQILETLIDELAGPVYNAPDACILNGLCTPIEYFQSSKNNDIYDVLPFVAPEVLKGQSYTFASDIYSFSMIMWEYISEVPPFDNEAYDFQLSLDICKGKRPKDIENIPKFYIDLMKRYHNTNEYLLNNGDLQNYLEKNFKSLTWINKKHLALQIAEGLNYLHNENILHRDLGKREATIKNTPEDYEKLYKQCWDSEPEKRPTIKIILVKIKKFIIENLYQSCLDSNPEKKPTIIEILEVSKTMGLLGLPFEELFQKYFAEIEEISVNDNNISAEVP